MSDTVKVTLPGGSVVYARPEVAARLAANGGTVDVPEPKPAKTARKSASEE